MQGNVLLHTGDGLSKTIAFDRLDQVVDGVHLECVKGELTVSGDENDRRGITKVLKRVGQLKAVGFGHVDVQEHDIALIFL